MNKMSYKNSSKCRRRKLYRKDIELREYIHENKRKRVHIVTTRFTNESYEELQRFKENNNLIGTSLFNIPIKLRFTNVSYEYPMIVLEMNNSENKLMGMGFIINKTYGMNNSYNIYTNKNYNRYTYKSRFYISFNKRSNELTNEKRTNEQTNTD